MFPILPMSAAEELVNALLNLLRQRPNLRPGILVASLLLAIASAVGAVVFINNTPQSVWPVWVALLGIAGVGAVGVTIATLLSYAGIAEVGLGSFRVVLKALENKVEAEPENPYAYIRLGAAELRAFYAINQSQARSSFRFGVTTVLLGLVFILAGVVLLYTERNVTPAIITSAGGVLAEFIGGTSLYLFNRVQTQSAYYHDYLGNYQRLMLAVSLCSDIEDGELRDSTRRELALEIIEASNKVVPPAFGLASRKESNGKPKTSD